MNSVQDQWTASTNYESFMGRWSRRLAPEFVAWLNMPGGVHWLDVGCGTGALTNAICDFAHPASVVGCDPAPDFIEFARGNRHDTRQSFVKAGIGQLPHHPDGFGSVTSLLALNFLPDPVGAVGEMCEVARPGATISACVWDYSQGMLFLRYFWDAVVSLDPAAAGLDEGFRFPICHREALMALFDDGGLEDVCCESLEISTGFANFDDYWRPFLGGTGPAPSYVASLDNDSRINLAHVLDASLPRGSDGAINLVARAWAVRGITAR